jgi:alkyldihydroxyacetonephosphate synthase
MAEPDKLVEELEKILPGRVIRNVSGYLKDWWPLFWVDRNASGEAIAVVRPENIDEILKLVRFANSSGLKIIPRGGGSSVTGSSVPQGGVVLDMRGLNQILDLDEFNRTVTVQVGVALDELERRLNARGYTHSQFPQSFDQATVGGYISTFGSGQYSTLYGGVEESVLRVEVVIPSGDVLWTRMTGSPRSSMGPDLSRLFIGAEGSLGVITAAELKIRKLPKHLWKAAFVFKDYESALNECRSLMDLDVKPAACRAYNETESIFQFGEQRCVTLLVYHFSSREVMDDVVNEVSAQFGQSAEPLSSELVDLWLMRRFNYREELKGVQKMGYLPETVEVGVKWGRLFELYKDVVERFKKEEGVAGVGAHVSHLYDQGACIYFTFIFKPEKDVYWRIWDTMFDVAKSHEATLSHHHGMGALKSRYAEREIPVVLIQAIKKGLDPNDILQGQIRS